MELYTVFSFVSEFLWSTYTYKIHPLVVCNHVCSVMSLQSIPLYEGTTINLLILPLLGSESVSCWGLLQAMLLCTFLCTCSEQCSWASGEQQQGLKVRSGDLWEFLRSSEGDRNIKTIFIIMLEFYLPTTAMFSRVYSGDPEATWCAGMSCSAD